MIQDNRGYEEYLVAYFDILGFKSDIDNFHKYGVLEKYKTVLQSVERQEWAVDCIWFSDSFVFYKKIDSEKSICGGIAASQLFFREMFLRHILLRGCLNIGSFYAEEDKGIFFGPSLTQAYELAEKQNWIGFVLSNKVETRLKQLKNSKYSVWDILKRQFIKYDVPCRRKESIKLQAYNFKSSNIYSTDTSEEESIRLWNIIIQLQKRTLSFLHEKEKIRKDFQKCVEYRKIFMKYKNTKKFLLKVFPMLKNRITGMNNYISSH